MGSLTHGMDLEEVEDLGRFLKERASDLDRLVSGLDGRIRSTTWDGPDAHRFKHQWWPQKRAQLLQASERVRGLGQSAQNNAADQRSASEAGPGGPSGGGGGGGGGGGWGPEGSSSAIDALEEIDEAKNLLRALELLEMGKSWDEVARLLATGDDALPKEYLKSLGLVIGTAKVLAAAEQHGWGSDRTLEAIAGAVGSEVVGKYAPVVGPLVWDPAWDTFLRANEGAKHLGESMGEGYVGWADRTFNDRYGSDEGWAAGRWLQHTYGVSDIDQLDSASAAEAQRLYRDHNRSAGGFYTTILGVSWRDGWWSLKDSFR